MKATEKKLLKDTLELYNGLKLAMPVSDDLRELISTIQERFDKMSEGAQESEKGQKFSESIESLEFIADSMDAINENLEDLSTQFMDFLEVES